MMCKPTDVHELKAKVRRISVSRLSVSYSTENTPMIAGLGKVRFLLGILCLLYFTADNSLFFWFQTCCILLHS